MAVLDNSEVENKVLSAMTDRQQMSYSEIYDICTKGGIGKDELNGALDRMEKQDIIASRNTGGIMTYYLLDENPLRKVLIVEDDKNINKLMSLSIGKEFEVKQIYDGGEAVPFIRENRPNLVLLDLMLPHKDGLDICQTIKSDPETSSTVIILISAMDPTSNRFNGIKYGADYYIKKPFDPKELRALVNLFLRKKGKRFDPLIDLPDEDRISNEVERSLKESGDYTIGTLRIAKLGEYARKLGEKSAMVIIRLVSQLLQDTIKNSSHDMFVGFLSNDEFIITGDKGDVNKAVEEVRGEFGAVMPFVLQDAGYKPGMEGLESMFESEDFPKLDLVFSESDKEEIAAKRDKILVDRGIGSGDISSYTYDELQKMLGNGDLDIVITRDPDGIKLRVGRDAANNE
ncbi:response regulator receiver modulated diguanylate cyclase [mine drainage metagenome]|uniref:Response regulator receiver modulated diguanylate cyclase n=1 Tax=mine drainage metagenome TaxID=410659 RepID=T0YTX3_9ZZZZ